MDDLYCIGCGTKLQTEDESKEGYVDPKALNREFILCKRCFQLQHYGKYKEAKVVKDPIKLINSKASKNDLMILVCDVSLVNTPLIKIFDKLSIYKNLIIVANRYDLYQDKLSKDKALKFLKEEFKKTKLKPKEYFIIDNNIDEIFDYIDNNSKDNDVYLLGVENAGKTTFINEILKTVAKEDENFITASKYPGTTINLVPIKIDDTHILYDTPGIKSPGNILNFVDKKFIQEQGFDNKVTELVYQMGKLNALIISNLVVLEFVDGVRQSIIFYGSSMYEVTRCSLVKLFSTFGNKYKFLKLKDEKIDSISLLDTIKLDITEPKIDVVIEGFGFFTLHPGTFVLHVPYGVNVYTRKAMI